MTHEQDLLRRIEAHCARRGIAVSTFGRRAVNDGKLADRLRSGKSITLDTLRKVEAALASPASPTEEEAA